LLTGYWQMCWIDPLLSFTRKERPAGCCFVGAPHPDPLPRGEGTACPVEGAGSDRKPFSVRKTILPLPAGEGRGEGPFLWCGVGCSPCPYFTLGRNPLRSLLFPAASGKRRILKDTCLPPTNHHPPIDSCPIPPLPSSANGTQDPHRILQSLKL